MNPGLKRMVIWENKSSESGNCEDGPLINMDVVFLDGSREGFTGIDEETALNSLKAMFSKKGGR